MEEATFLTRFATTVTIVHRASGAPCVARSWSSEHVQTTGSGGSATPRWQRRTAARQLTGLRLRHRVTGAESELSVDGMFVAIGHDPRSELVRGQVALDDQGYVVTGSRTTRTDLPGVFAAGDLVDHTYRQAITAAGSGCMAAMDA